MIRHGIRGNTLAAQALGGNGFRSRPWERTTSSAATNETFSETRGLGLRLSHINLQMNVTVTVILYALYRTLVALITQGRIY